MKITDKKRIAEEVNKQGYVYILDFMRDTWELEPKKTEVRRPRGDETASVTPIYARKPLPFGAFVETDKQFMQAIDKEYEFIWTDTQEKADYFSNKALEGDGLMWRLNPETAVNF